MYKFTSYSEITPGIIAFFNNVCGISNIRTLTLQEINSLIRDAEEWYEERGQSFSDFIIDDIN